MVPPRNRRRLARPLLATGVGLLLAAVPGLPAVAVTPPTTPTTTPTAPGSALTVVPAAQGRHYDAGNYVVTLAQDPIAKYDGSLPGIPQLKSATGGLDLSRATTRRYRDLLLGAQQKIADAVGVQPEQRYTVALNGFSAKLTSAQAGKLAATPGVVSVVPDSVRHLTGTTTDGTGTPGTSGTAAAATQATPQAAAQAAPQAAAQTGAARTTADYLGLSGENGVWAQLGGVAKAGKGVVVADLDTGLWPEHPSVAGAKLPTSAPADDPYGAYRSGQTIRMAKADGGTFTGVCETGQGWTAADCTTKVVGARAFGEGFKSAYDLAGTEFDSARDSDGHGTHTATTAVGLNGVPATIGGVSYGDVTGIAPAAAVAVYKVCWTGDDGDNSCMTSDLVAAIDQAVADDVDVINYSIGGGASADPADPVSLAFLSAASAGIFVSASAGNSGPGASTVENTSPWITTVAAATSVLREGTVVLGDGTKLVGARLQQSPLPRTPLVLGSAVAAAGHSADDAAKCFADSLDPARTKGKVVVCQRAVTARVDKSKEVARAGGAGMVLYNPTPNSLEPDAHSVPTVHLDTAAGEQVVAYVKGTRNPTVTFQPGNTTGKATPAPQIAAFSGRGPALVDGGDVLKPDLAAPGSGVVAGYSPVAATNGEDLFAPESGTSMSAPHVTGLAALYTAAHPEFSPLQVKSALMTTSRSPLGPDGKPLDHVFPAGAGFVDPTKMLTPGLVYDSTPVDWLRFLEGSSVGTGTGLTALDPSELNQASLAVADLAGTRTLTRSVTATTGGLYYAKAWVQGFDVKVSPSVLSLQPGQTAQFRVTFTRTTAQLGNWTSGFLTWTGGANLTVRSPIALRPVTLTAPAELDAPLGATSVTGTVSSGTSGRTAVRATGLVAGDDYQGRLPAGYVAELPVTIGKGTVFTRFDVKGEAGADLDLYLFTADGDLVAQSATTSADERIDGYVTPGDYVLQLDGYAAAPGKQDIGFDLSSYVLPPGTGAGAFTVTPNPLPLTQGRSTTFTASWKGLAPGTRYLGTLGYAGTSARTVVSIG
ncbi:S8 family serine peptidase [Kineococcus rhizosphaerae]|uniref:Peptidase inhibitor I9 n=1 Tax=Kineococcus rhizosphaerae TaxID=559628 RepID=A0A2T0R7D5_9ACTN|nr:S8 family serine peptidase [Kineococcus rhizosphaerae]PRY17051.1 peptidase inhibitor I9 [Kineococcus rhizosphaerae]